MTGNVAIIGCGYSPVRVTTPEVSYRELTFEAASRAYADAHISHEEIQALVCCEEDFFEGLTWGLEIDLFNFQQSIITFTFLRRTDLSSNRVSGTQVKPADL